MKKKTFTFVAMQLFAIASMNAAVLWTGARTYANGRALPTADDRVVIGAEAFADAQVGDRLLFEFDNYADDPLTSQHLIRLSVPLTYEDLSRSINVSEGDKRSSVTIDATILEKLKASGLVLGGTGYTVYSVSLEPANGTLWEGYKVINNTGWTSGVVLAAQFADAQVGDVLLLEAEKTGEGAQCILRVRGSWADLPSDQPQGNYLDCFDGDGLSRLTFTLNAEALQALQANGLIVAGTQYVLHAVALATAAGITHHADVHGQCNETAYGIDGIRVQSNGNAYRPALGGIYIVNGKKLMKR